MSLVLAGDTSGSGTLTVPVVAGTFTATIGSATGTHYPFTSGTAVASTSGTSIDFTSLPSWIKRITVMFSAVSTSGTSNPLVQLGTSGGIDALTYVASASAGTSGVSTTGYTTGFGIKQTLATDSFAGTMVFTLVGSNTWVGVGTFSQNGGGFMSTAGSKTLSGTLDRIRITTVGGTDTFDAGSINILYE